MTDHEERDGARRKEVNRPGRLMAAERRRQPRRHRRDGGRHRQTGDDDERKEHEDDTEVRDALDDIVRISGTREERSCKRTSRREQVAAEMFRDESRQDVAADR